MHNCGVIGVESWTISYTFAVIFSATAPHPGWHWKPCSGLLSDGCVCTNYEIVKKNILALIDKRGMEEGATHSFSYKIFFIRT